MGLTGTLKNISTLECPHCNKKYGLHSKKGYMKCLYTANYNLYKLVLEFQDYKREVESKTEQPQTTQTTNSEVQHVTS